MSEAALAQFQKRHLQVEKTGQSTSVPNDNVARLMYYLSCISSLTDNSIPSRLTSYRQYNSLNSTERLQVIALACELTPEKIPLIVEMPSLPGSNSNMFLKFSSLDETVTALGIQSNGAAMMALRRQLGNKRDLIELMAYTPDWLRSYYLNPLVSIRRELEHQQMLQALERQREDERRRRKKGCTIQ